MESRKADVEVSRLRKANTELGGSLARAQAEIPQLLDQLRVRSSHATSAAQRSVKCPWRNVYRRASPLPCSLMLHRHRVVPSLQFRGAICAALQCAYSSLASRPASFFPCNLLKLSNEGEAAMHTTERSGQPAASKNAPDLVVKREGESLQSAVPDRRMHGR